jgi:hypothetical protein
LFCGNYWTAMADKSLHISDTNQSTQRQSQKKNQKQGRGAASQTTHHCRIDIHSLLLTTKN